MSRLCLLATLALVACRPAVTPPSGNVADRLALTTLDGQSFNPDSLKGKPAVVLFWRVGCSYCMHELPVVAQVAKDKGAAAVAVMVAGAKDKAAEVTKDFDGTVLVDDGSLRDRYQITKVPYTLILRGDGTASKAFLGEQSAGTIGGALDEL